MRSVSLTIKNKLRMERMGCAIELEFETEHIHRFFLSLTTEWRTNKETPAKKQIRDKPKYFFIKKQPSFF